MEVTDWDLIKTFLSIIGLLVSGAVWVMILVSRVSIRVRDQERDIQDLKAATTKLEEKTSFEHMEEVTTKVMLQVVHSNDFKSVIRDVVLHSNKNRESAEAGVFNEILHQLQELKK